MDISPILVISFEPDTAIELLSGDCDAVSDLVVKPFPRMSEIQDQ